MPIDLYYERCSPPCNAVIAVARALKIPLNLIFIDLDKGENLTPDFYRLNPQREIPTLVDDGFALWESRAICIYLVEKYGQADRTLYPLDVQQRATVNQRLLFDQSTLYSRLATYFYPQVFFRAPADERGYPRLLEAIGLLDVFLGGGRHRRAHVGRHYAGAERSDARRQCRHGFVGVRERDAMVRGGERGDCRLGGGGQVYGGVRCAVCGSEEESCDAVGVSSRCRIGARKIMLE